MGAVQGCSSCALADAPNAFGSTLERERDLNEDAWRERVAALAARFFAFRNEQPVGLVGAGMEPTGEVELVSMWVAPGSRRSGVGRALIDAVVDDARLHGSRSVLLWVADGNEAAERLYESQGFVRTGLVQPVDEADPLPRRRVSDACFDRLMVWRSSVSTGLYARLMSSLAAYPPMMREPPTPRTA